MKKVIVLGASIAGLSAANALLDRGLEVLLIDAGSGPTVKACGEFLSSQANKLLHEWDIEPKLEVSQAHFYVNKKELVYVFPEPYYSMPRLSLEKKLLQRFMDQGGVARFHTQVCGIDHIDSKVRIHLNLEEILEAKEVVISLGRWQGMKVAKAPQYMGIKNHFWTSKPIRDLHMGLFKGGYIGISPIETYKIVVSCLVKQANNLPNNLENTISLVPQLSQLLKGSRKVASQDICVPVGSFGYKNPPHWPHCYFIGDSIATIAPILGEGMTHALLSGKFVAGFVGRSDWIGYRKFWKKAFHKRVIWSQCLNAHALSFKYLPASFYFLQKYPKLISFLHTWGQYHI